MFYPKRVFMLDHIPKRVGLSWGTNSIHKKDCRIDS